MLKLLPVVFFAFSSMLCAQIIYVSDRTTTNVYKVDLSSPTPDFVLFATPPVGYSHNLLNIRQLDSSTAYGMVGELSVDNYIVKIDLSTQGSYYTQISDNYTPGTPLFDAITILDAKTLYMADRGNSQIVKLDLSVANPAYSIVANNPIAPAVPDLTGVAALSSSVLYISGSGIPHPYDISNVYVADIGNPGGNYEIVNPQPAGANPGFNEISILDPSTAYMPCWPSGIIYKVDLLNPGSPCFPVAYPPAGPAPNLQDLTILNSSTAYALDAGGNIYRIDLLTPGSTYTLVAHSSTLNDLWSITTLRAMDTTNLHWNDLRLAKYLNKNAPAFSPLSTVGRLSSVLPGQLDHALKMVSPVRNALGTFAVQTMQSVFAQQISSHLSKNRISANVFSETASAFHEQDDQLIAGCFSKHPPRQKICQTYMRPEGNYSPWIEFFGNLDYQKAQLQTPSYTAASAGCIAALDYNGAAYPHPLGGAIAYAHSYIHEDHRFGHINADLGSAGLFGSFMATNWRFDLSLWGSYYHLQNLRRIDIPWFSGQAQSKTHGWQAAPHFEVSYDYIAIFESINRVGIEPFAMVDWVSSWEHRLRESGTGGLFDFGQKGRWCSFLRTEAGLRLNKMVRCRWGTVTFQEKGGYAYQKLFRTGKISTFLIGSPGSVNMITLTGAQNMGVGEIEVIFTPYRIKYPRASLAYRGEFGSRYQSNQILFTAALDY